MAIVDHDHNKPPNSSFCYVLRMGRGEFRHIFVSYKVCENHIMASLVSHFEINLRNQGLIIHI